MVLHPPDLPRKESFALTQNRKHRYAPFEKVAIFIDGSNFYYAVRQLNIQVDYKRLLEYFTQDAILLRAFYYTGLDEHSPDGLIRLCDWLAYNGYTVVTKRPKRFVSRVMGENGSETLAERIKGDIDIELAIDMLALADRYDRAVLFSGDGDLRRLVEAVQMKGVRVQVVSTLKTNPPMLADELRRQADEFIELSDIADEIQREASPWRREDHPDV